MATGKPRKSVKGGGKLRAPRGGVSGMARIRMWTNAIETAMIERYIGNAPTLKDLRAVVKATLRDIRRIRPMAQSDCPDGLMHELGCTCTDPVI